MAFKLYGTKMKVLLHLAAWAIILGLPLYNFFRWDVPREFVWGFYIMAIVNGILFYGNYLLLVPKLFLQNKLLKYSTAALLLAVFMFMSSVISLNVIRGEARRDAGNRPGRDRIEMRQDRPPDGRRRILQLPFGSMSIYHFTFNALVFTVFALGLKALERHSETEKRQKELEKEKLNSELAFLKNQISPHFFFNTLNNIYSLIAINTGDSQKAVLQLSRMMRYLLYESEQGDTRLSDEIEFMNNYIDLMRLRISDKVQLSITFPEKYDNVTIPPLLFISVIENAFKHGVSYRERSFIDISMTITKELLTFRCENSLVKKSESESVGNSGIGLENLRKRLALIFPGSHELKIDRSPKSFLVSVNIHL